MDIRKVFGTDKVLEKEGVWIDLGEGAQVKIARTGTEAYSRRFQDLMRPHRKAFQRKTLSDKKAEEIIIRVTAETVLVDWKGLEYDGKSLDYSVDNAIMLLTEVKDFRAMVADVSDSMDSYKAQEDEDSEKNLKKSSSGGTK